jgi:NADPH:quinone reductase-like Zn-dependent oxidoreductase
MAKGQKSYPFFTVEAGGVVSKIGAKVTGVQAGDRVVCLKPNKFDTTLTVGHRLCYNLRPADTYEDFVSQLHPFTFATYALKNVCRLRGTDNILIDVPSPDLSFALVQIAMLSGSTIYATYSSQAQHDQLSGLEGVHLIPSERLARSEFTPQLIFQVIISNGSMNLGLGLRRITDRDARLVLLPGRASTDLTDLSTSLRLSCLTVSYLDPWQLASSDTTAVSGSLRETMRLLQDGLLTRIPYKSFDLAKIGEAGAYVNGSRERTVLTCNPDITSIPVKIIPKPLEFDSNGSYILIGCLGGLGRSLT